MFRSALGLLLILTLTGCFGGQRVTETGGGSPSDDMATTPDGDPLICHGGETATLDRVIDGDTIDVRFADDRIERIRLIGIDTPERGESCFTEATARLAELLGDAPVRLLKDKSERDRYGRLLRYVCSGDGVFTEARLVRDGLALPYRYRPDTYYADYLQELGAEAALDASGCLFRAAMRNSDASGSACCLICRNGKACGDVCIPPDVTCRLPTGCACDG